MAKKGLKLIRAKIDVVDNKIVALLRKRNRLALQTLKYKKTVGDSKRVAFILNKVKSRYAPALTVFKAIIKESKVQQKKAKVR